MQNSIYKITAAPFLFCFILVFSCLKIIAQTHDLKTQNDTELALSFSKFKNNNTLEEISNNYFPVFSLRKQIEKVSALFGTGIRTDGNSTYLTVPFALPVNGNVTVNGWFALETYPTDTAGFFALKNKSNTQWFSACVNQYGHPLIGVHTNNVTKYFKSETIISKFKWLHIALVLKNELAEMYVDGKRILFANTESSIEKNRFDSLVVGKDEMIRSVGIFSTNHINGIIDEVVVLKGSMDETDFAKINYGRITALRPNLNIPAIRFENDFNRPRYHLLPAANWTNETHGLIWYRGSYHIFNQKDGTNLLLRNINWGHFTSPDLLHWTEQHPALSPQEGSDERGIWSGHCIITVEGKPAIIYTGAKNTGSGMHLALPEDNSLLVWKKYEGNPVIKGVPPGYKRHDFRDPYLFIEDGSYYMAVGFGIDEADTRRGAVLLFKSSNLKEWKFLHTLYEGDPVNDGSGVFWEMPVFWKENGKYILLVNKVPHNMEPANALYWVGDFVNEKFVPLNKIPRKLEVINQLLSPSVAKDKDGLTTAIAIIPDLISNKAQNEQGWTHLYSIPRTWSLKDNKIIQQPHPALQSLRGKVIEFKTKSITEKKPLVIIKGSHQVEIEADIGPKNCKRFGFIVGMDTDGKELTRIIYDFDKQQFSVDKSMSSINKNIPVNGRSGTYALPKNKNVNIRLFIDGSVVEVFINNEEAFTTRIFPSGKNSNNVALFCEGDNIELIKARVWQLKGTGNNSNF